MAKRTRWLAFVSLAIIVVAAGSIMLLGGKDDPATRGPGTQLGAQDESDDPSSGTPSSSPTAPPPDGTLASTEQQETPPISRVKDKPLPPVGDPPAPGVDPTAAWQAYIEETREVVQNNRPSLADAVAVVTHALTADDAGALAGMVAPDESAGTFAAGLVAAYPNILESAPGSNVNVFTNGQATVYFAYVLVTWEDAGISSQHTIPIMFRYVDGEWCLTTLGETGDDLQFVQSVVL